MNRNTYTSFSMQYSLVHQNSSGALLTLIFSGTSFTICIFLIFIKLQLCAERIFHEFLLLCHHELYYISLPLDVRTKTKRAFFSPAFSVFYIETRADLSQFSHHSFKSTIAAIWQTYFINNKLLCNRNLYIFYLVTALFRQHYLLFF